MSWKQFCYFGYNITYENFETLITTSANNGITHLLLEFIVLQYNGGTDPNTIYEIIYYDTILNWMQFTSQQRTDLINLATQNGIKIVASFGGATTFIDNNGLLGFLNSNSIYTNYVTMAEVLLNYVNNNNLDEIDLDIEHINGGVTEQETQQMYNWMGLLSRELKTAENLPNNTPLTYLTHAPQTPYFYNGYFNGVYLSLENFYGEFIDCYLTQFYNQGNTYNNFDEIFINDPVQLASVLQIESYGIPIEKIIVGKATDAQPGMGDVVLWDGTTNPLVMNNIVNNTLTYPEPLLQTWLLNSGIMVWIYRTDADAGYNSTIMNYFSNNLGGTCFIKGTQIKIKKNNIEIEEKIENLKDGDLVKISNEEYKKIVFIGYNYYSKTDYLKNVYVMKKNSIDNNIPNQDLLLTAGHSLLFNEPSNKYKNNSYNENQYPENEKIDNYTKIKSSHCSLFQNITEDIIKDKLNNINKLEYYHLVLEDNNKDKQHGIFANNVLCETMSYNYIPKSLLYKKN